MEIEDWEDLLEIPDLRTAVLLMKKWNIVTKGVANLDDAISRLVAYWENNKGPVQITEEQKASGIEAAIRSTRKTSQQLVDKYKDTHDFFKKLPKKIKNSLQSVFPDPERTFKDRIAELSQGECTILVAGEVGAGKSSLINLLLGTELLPTHQLKCTNTICELRSSSRGEKEAHLFYKEVLGKDGKLTTPPKRVISLKELSGIKEFQACLVEVDTDYEENPYERVEVYCPFPMLREGMVIVDTPGIEGGNNVVKRLEKYLSKAFGFIYVVNTNAAGGVSRGRLQHLLNMVVNSADDFSPEASMFVCNKWEQVPASDKRALQADILAKLQRVYPGVRESQIHYMSVKKSQNAVLRFNARIREHRKFLAKTENFLPNCLRQGLNGQYIWLSNFLKRAAFFLKVSNVTEAKSREKIQEEYQSLVGQVEKLKKNTDEKVRELRERVKFQLFKIKNEIKDILQSRDMTDMLCTWDARDCPEGSKWKVVVEDAACAVADRITHCIDRWEKQTGILRRIDDEIVIVFTREFGLVEHQVKDLEDVLLKSRGVGQLFHTVKIVPVKALFKAKKKKNIQKTYKTLGGAVSNIGSLVTSDRQVKKLFNTKDKKVSPEKMGEAMALYIRSILENKDFDVKLEKFFSRFTADIDAAAKRIPGFLQADQHMIETLNEKLHESDKSQQEFPLLAVHCSDLVSKLDIFYINQIMTWDYVLGDRGDIAWHRDRCLGSGSFADVFVGTMKDKRRDVALKVFKVVVTKENVSDILTEDRIMRDLNHVNLVRYFGATFVPQGDVGLKWVMVMEMCQSSLKTVYVDTQNVSPGKFSEEDPRRAQALRRMAEHVLQMATGLDYIHHKGYAHRDLKLENVLLGTDGSVKLTDVGVAKPINLIAATCAGSPAYMAPEVLLGSRNHDGKADIYSLAFVEWEMWYGSDVTNYITQAVLSSYETNDAIQALKKEQERGENSFRPTFAKLHRPPAGWIELIRRSWSYDPDLRPTARIHVEFFKEAMKG